jgi:hypothetical protein
MFQENDVAKRIALKMVNGFLDRAVLGHVVGLARNPTSVARSADRGRAR